MLVLQSFAQLEIQYGKKEAETIIGNVSNWIYLHSPDPQLLKYISSISGERTDEFTHLTTSLLSINQLKYFKKINKEGLTECLMLLGRKHPFIAYLPDISRYYGIERLDCIDIPKRKSAKLKTIDFLSLVKEREKERVRKKLDSENPYRSAMAGAQENKEAMKRKAADKILSLMDAVIYEIKEANNELRESNGIGDGT